MNKQLITLIIVGFFLVSLTTAVITGTPKNTTVTQETKDILDAINNESIERGDIICNELTCSQRMWKGNYQLGEVVINRLKCKTLGTQIDINTNQKVKVCIDWIDIKDNKIIEEITKQQNKKLEEIAKTITKRAEKELNKKLIEDKGEIILGV